MHRCGGTTIGATKWQVEIMRWINIYKRQDTWKNISQEDVWIMRNISGCVCVCMCLCTPIYPHAFLMYIVLVLGNQITTQNEICVKNQFTTDNHE